MTDLMTPASEQHEPKFHEMSSLESGLVNNDQFSGLYNDSVEIFRWKDLKLTLPASGKRPEKVLLDGISGEARAGELKTD